MNDTFRSEKIKDAASSVVGRIFEMPAEAFPGGWMLTVTDGAGAYISGCAHILSYSKETISVMTVGEGAALEIVGSGLDIVHYSGADISIRGKITSFSISGGVRGEDFK